MQLHDTEIRPVLEDLFRAAWNPANLRPDAPRLEEDASNLPDCRIDLTEWDIQPTGRGVSAREVLIPHTYVCSCKFPYPAAGNTVNAVAVTKVNEALKLISQNWPRLAGWALGESMPGAIRDNAEEQTYEVEITLTIEVISPSRFGN